MDGEEEIKRHFFITRRPEMIIITVELEVKITVKGHKLHRKGESGLRQF